MATRTALEVARENAAHAANRVFVITGAYSGIGAETTKALLQVGARVVVGGRNPQLQDEFVQSLKDTYDANLIDGHVLDLGDLHSVKGFSNYVKSKYPKVDCLINNAGVMNCPASLTKDGFEMQMGVNVIGHFLLAKLLLPVMLPEGGRQVWLSSSAHTRNDGARIDIAAMENFDVKDPNYSGWHQYQQSKLGDILLAKEFAARYAESNKLEAVSVHPGVIRTNLGRHVTIWQMFPLLFRILWRGMSFKTVEQGAATTLTCATLPSDSDKFVNGAYFADCEVMQPAESANNRDDSKALYDFCDKVTKNFQ